MNSVRIASGLYLLLAVHIAADGVYPLLNGWKVKLGSVPFFVGSGLLVVSLLLLFAPTRTRFFAFCVALVCAFISAAATVLPLVLDGEFAPGSYPYPGGQLFVVIQLAGYVGVALLLRRRLASNKLLQATREDARA
jgi:hypothetical protein